MKHPLVAAGLAAVTGVCLGIAACTHAPERDTAGPGMYSLLIDGGSVPVPVSSSLLEALRRKASALLLDDRSGPANSPPLVVLDGTPLREGLPVLRTITVCDVAGVRLLRAVDAVRLYGGAGGAGAIVVRTHRGGEPAARVSC